jgi:hypothetical protein
MRQFLLLASIVVVPYPHEFFDRHYCMFLEVVINALSETIGFMGWGAGGDLLLEDIALFSDFLEGYESVLFLFYLCVLLLDVFLLLED